MNNIKSGCRETVFVTDALVNLLYFVSDNPWELSFQKGDNFLALVDETSQDVFFEFIKGLKQKGYGLGCQINLKCNNQMTATVGVSGYLQDETIHFFVREEDQENSRFLIEIMKINNEYINQLRQISKENTKVDEQAYLEISRLNNELINTRRIVEQQNKKLQEYNEILEEMALKDTLTGTWNRRSLMQKFPHLVNEARLSKSNIVVVNVDLDHFKKVNDQMGHDAGDALLKTFVQLAQPYLAKMNGLLFRFGGDEFVFLFLDKDEKTVAKAMDELNLEYVEYNALSALSYGIIDIKHKELELKVDLAFYLRLSDEKMYQHKKAKYEAQT